MDYDYLQQKEPHTELIPHIPREELYQKFKDKLRTLGITVTWKWEDASRLLFNEPEWKAIRTFSEKRNLFNEYITDLKNKEREEIYLKREKNKSKFRQLLSEDNTINSDSTYTEVMSRLSYDERWRSVDEKEREDIFEDYIDLIYKKEEDEWKKEREVKKKLFLEKLKFKKIKSDALWKNIAVEFKDDPVFASMEKIDRIQAFADYITARGADSRAGSKERLDARDGAACGSGRHGDDTLAFAGHGGSAHKVNLATDTAVLTHADGFTGHLSHEVDLETGVDGDHAILLGDDDGVVGVVDRIKLDIFVAIDKIIQFAGAHNEGSHDLTFVHGLTAAVDDTFLHEFGHTVGEHLGMDAKVILVAQFGEDGIGDGTDTELEGGTVGHQRGAMAANGLFHLGGGVAMQFRKSIGTRDDVIDLRDMNHVVATDKGHHLVGLDDDGAGATDGGEGIVAADTEGAITLLVGRRGLENGHFAGNLVANHLGDIVEISREKVTFQVVDSITRVTAEEVADMAKMAIAAGMEQGIVAKGGHVENEDVIVILAMVSHGLGHHTWNSSGVAHDDAVSVMNILDGLLGSGYFSLIFFFPVHHFSVYFLDGKEFNILYLCLLH